MNVLKHDFCWTFCLTKSRQKSVLVGKSPISEHCREEYLISSFNIYCLNNCNPDRMVHMYTSCTFVSQCKPHHTTPMNFIVKFSYVQYTFSHVYANYVCVQCVHTACMVTSYVCIVQDSKTYCPTSGLPLRVKVCNYLVLKHSNTMHGIAYINLVIFVLHVVHTVCTHIHLYVTGSNSSKIYCRCRQG